MDWISTGTSIASALFAVGLFSGVTRTQLQRLESDVKSLQEDYEKTIDRFVTLQQFNSTISRLEKANDEMGKDLKQILSVVSKLETKL